MKLNKWLMLIVMLVLAVGSVYAGNWGDNFSVTLTPAGDRGVIIDTTTFDLGFLTLGTTQQVTNPVPVKSTGTLGGIEYTMQASISGGWTLSTDGYADTQDELVVMGLFNTTQPTQSDYESPEISSHVITTSAKQVGNSGGADVGYFEGNDDMDNLGLNVTKNLWLRFKLPPTSSTGAQQTVSVTVNAEAAN